MADIVLCIGTSHTPLLSLQPELWLTYAEGDYKNPELAFPPNGWVMPYHDGVEYVSPEVRAKFHSRNKRPSSSVRWTRWQARFRPPGRT